MPETYCTACGAEFSSQWAFCAQCGQKADAGSAARAEGAAIKKEVPPRQIPLAQPVVNAELIFGDDFRDGWIEADGVSDSGQTSRATVGAILSLIGIGALVLIGWQTLAHPGEVAEHLDYVVVAIAVAVAIGAIGSAFAGRDSAPTAIVGVLGSVMGGIAVFFLVLLAAIIAAIIACFDACFGG